ncbi:hypothetical protein CW304_11980 [Bacillus sp. UFRGS-B20]|nr:hypothetical protein CW304_11980 [Bacillus sp. UFRGS-B20]
MINSRANFSSSTLVANSNMRGFSLTMTCSLAFFLSLPCSILHRNFFFFIISNKTMYAVTNTSNLDLSHHTGTFFRRKRDHPKPWNDTSFTIPKKILVED